MRVLALFCFFLIYSRLAADFTAYSEKRTVTAKSAALMAVHVHDWSSGRVAELFNDLAHHEAFLGEKNDFAYIEVADAKGRVLFRRPSAALTTLWISPNSKYIVGLSSIMLHNPFQIMVWRADGTLIYREHISPSIARLASREFAEFCAKYPIAKEVFRERFRENQGMVDVDYEILGMPNAIGDEAWGFLFAHRRPNPYSDDFGSTVTNSVFWYDAKNPRLRIVETEQRTAVFLASPTGKTMRIIVDDRTAAASDGKARRTP